MSLLEGGLSDRALIAGGLVWLTGLAGYEPPLEKDKRGTLSENEEAVAANRFTRQLDGASSIKEWFSLERDPEIGGRLAMWKR